MEYKILGGIIFAAFLALIFYLVRKDAAADADAKVVPPAKNNPNKSAD